jgi:hypothetical protein
MKTTTYTGDTNQKTIIYHGREDCSFNHFTVKFEEIFVIADKLTQDTKIHPPSSLNFGNP